MSRGRVKIRLKQIQLENKRQDDNIDLKKEIERLKALVDYYRFDELTGLKTRKDLVFDYQKVQFPVSFILADINDLHNINRTLGYIEGDNFIKRKAAELKSKFGFENVYRIGGDEFLIINCNDLKFNDLKNITYVEKNFETKVSVNEIIGILDKNIIVQKKALGRRKEDRMGEKV